MFSDELEKQPEFGGFVDLFESFKLRRGKKESEEEEEDARVVGVFKVRNTETCLCCYTAQKLNRLKEEAFFARSRFFLQNCVVC